MKNTKKVLMGVLSVCLVVALAIGGTLAFLTDSEKATNTFTVGDLDITLAEPAWDDANDGKDMIPGDTFAKDPTVTAVENDSYMRVVMTIKDKTTGTTITDAARLAKIMKTIRYGADLEEGTGYASADLATYDNVNSAFTEDAAKSGNGVYYYNYNTVLAEGDDAVLFTNIVVPTDWNQDDLAILGEYSVEVFAQAIQSTGFANATDAFTALDAEIAAGTMQEDYKTVS